MKFKSGYLMPVLLLLALLVGLLPAGAAGAAARSFPKGKIVVANRGSGSISVIHAGNGQLLGTLPLPPGESPPEPMYVVDPRFQNRVWVGDRANSRVVAFNASTFEVEASVPVGAGVFHMWADTEKKQLWVVNDIDLSLSVVDLETETLLATVPAPADLLALNGKPHDVIVDPLRGYAYTTINGVDGPNDYVVQFSTDSFEETGRAAVGKDAHLSLALQDDRLYVPAQGSGRVTVLDRATLAEITSLQIPGAHGAGMAQNGETFYTSNLPGGGAQGLFAIDTATNTLLGPALDTPYSGPHNIALTPGARKLYLTHSGPSSDKVTFYAVHPRTRLPRLVGEVSVGLNPFGIAYVP